MVRSKVKLELVADPSARKTTFRKRKKGLLKKMDELTTLCGVDACAIICSPYEAQPQVWPNPSGVQKVLTRFMNLPEEVQSRRMLDQEAFLKGRVKKATQQLERLRRENREKEVTNLMYDCLNGEKRLDELDMKEAMDLSDVLDKNIVAIMKRINELEIINRENFDNAGEGTSGSSGASA